MSGNRRRCAALLHSAPIGACTPADLTHRGTTRPVPLTAEHAEDFDPLLYARALRSLAAQAGVGAP